MTIKIKSSRDFFAPFLFAQSFSYATMMTPEACQEALGTIAQPPGSRMSFSPVSKTVNIQSDETGEADFDIRIRRGNNRGVDYTSAKAAGVIEVDEETGETVIEGVAQFGVLCYLLTAGYVLLFGADLLVSGMRDTFVALALLVVLVYMWASMFSDRNQLPGLIGIALDEAEAAANLTDEAQADEAAADEQAVYRREQR